jgi:hypothetical protein
MNLDPSRFNKYIAPAAAASLIAIGATACGSANTCESNFEATSTLPANSQPDGVEITTPMTADAKELEIAFTDPGGNWHGAWETADGATKLVMSIGGGAVQFGVRIKAAQSSEICGASPHARFVQKPYDEAINKDKAIAPNPSGFQKDKSIHVDEIVPVLSR